MREWPRPLLMACTVALLLAGGWFLVGPGRGGGPEAASALPEVTAQGEGASAPVPITAPVAAPGAAPGTEPGSARAELPAPADPESSASPGNEPRGPLPGLLLGTVVNAHNDQPVPGARVRAPGRPELVTDPAGRFRLPDPAGLRWLHVHAEGFAIAGLEVDPADLERTPEGDALLLTVPLLLGAGLEGRAVDPAGAGIAGIEVVLRRLSAPDPRLEGTGAEGPWVGLTDAEGRVRIGELPGSQRFGVELRLADGAVRRMEELRTRAGNTEEATWRLGPGRIAGTVVDGPGAPVPGASLVLVRSTSRRPRYMDRVSSRDVVAVATTDELGRYAMEGLPPGLFVLGPRRGRGEPTRWAPHMQPVELTDADPAQVVDLVLYRGLFVGGVLLRPDGAPAPSFHVRAWPTQGRGTLSESTDGQGRFRIGPLVPGIVGLEVDGRDGLGIWRTVDVEAGQEDLVLTLSPSAHLRGTALLPQGGPLDSAEVAFVPAPGETRNGFIVFGYSDRDGTFALSDAAPAVYDIVVQRAQDELIGYAAGISVGAGATRDDIRVKTERGGWVRLLYTGERTAVRGRYFSGNVQIDVDDLTSGRPHRQLVPPGPVTVRVEEKASGYREEVTVEVVPGQTVEVTF